ncbi:MAG TPA: LysM peptidoglycan-binding domain-containing protein [Amycolatopsis sp.]|uniref:LysM peptidoglycan-binding domain-containing protein n=1 Tax=Amycolatopsis sp. TaxID=37632 RepID=UPI002B49E610|nr:LysM peptidoglycan-binding domain-containing protein [Amycolatopsis sp.]HKS47119.1 LysM peptidoglycan-binding domain-containing protein [Amycolatopsis sp.]
MNALSRARAIARHGRSGHRVRIGRPLVVAVALVVAGAGVAAAQLSGSQPEPAAPVAQTVANTGPVSSPSPAPGAPAVAPPPAATVTRPIQARRGDTLCALARRYGSTVAELQRLNGLGNSTLIRAGQSLRVPAHAKRPGQSPLTHRPPVAKSTPAHRKSAPVPTKPAPVHAKPANATPAAPVRTGVTTTKTISELKPHPVRPCRPGKESRHHSRITKPGKPGHCLPRLTGMRHMCPLALTNRGDRK